MARSAPGLFREVLRYIGFWLVLWKIHVIMYVYLAIGG